MPQYIANIHISLVFCLHLIQIFEFLSEILCLDDLDIQVLVKNLNLTTTDTMSPSYNDEGIAGQ